MVALKGMFLQAAEFPMFWRLSTIHGIIWMASFLVTVLVDIAYGLGVGMFLSIVTLLWRSNRSEISILGAYANTDLYIDINANDQVRLIYFVLCFPFLKVEDKLTLNGKTLNRWSSYQGSR